MVGPQTVGCARYSPPPNPYLTQFQAPASSTLVPTSPLTGDNGGDFNGSVTTQEYAQALNSSPVRNQNISFKDREGEDSILTSGEPIRTDFPGRSGEVEEGTPENPGPLSTTLEHGDGTNEKGQISFGEKEPDLRPIKLNTVNGIVADTRKEADYAMGISDNPIERAMSGEGIPKTDD